MKIFSSYNDYFEKNEDGLLIGYHCEGGETFEETGSKPLSMLSLDNSRFLFIGKNQHEWTPFHLDLSEYRLYQVVFKYTSKIAVFDVFSEYQKLFQYSSDKKEYRRSKELQKLIDAGVYLFILDKNDQDELTEAFIVNPKDHVTFIKEINFPICETITMEVSNNSPRI